jgi:hypothetical protein
LIIEICQIWIEDSLLVHLMRWNYGYSKFVFYLVDNIERALSFKNLEHFHGRTRFGLLILLEFKYYSNWNFSSNKFHIGHEIISWAMLCLAFFLIFIDLYFAILSCICELLSLEKHLKKKQNDFARNRTWLDLLRKRLYKFLPSLSLFSNDSWRKLHCFCWTLILDISLTNTSWKIHLQVPTLTFTIVRG